MTTENRIAFRPGLILIVVAILCFLLAAFGVGSKLGIDLVDLGLAFFAGSFIF
jgi:hypothetical protein